MVEPKKKKKSISKRLYESRFLPTPSQKRKLFLGLGWLGSAILGAGVYAQFRVQLGVTGATGPMDRASIVLGVGAVLLAIVVLMLPEQPRPVLVGDLGVAVDDPDGEERLLWCDITKVSASPTHLVLDGKKLALSVPLEEHALAVGRILHELDERLPDLLDGVDVKSLPPYQKDAGTREPIEGLQVTGRRCKASKKTITADLDARLCPNCAEVYHKDHVPETCATCEGDLGDAALPIES